MSTPGHGAGRRTRHPAGWRLVAMSAALGLIACSSTPPPPDWQMNAKGSLERATAAYLAGNARLEAAEFARARSDLARTGRPDLVARAELVRCATRVASLVIEDCPGFAALAQDASEADRAYARFLAGTATAADLPLLPPQHRGTALAPTPDLATLPDPLSRLVAAGVALRRGAASPAVVRQAIDSASSQGWSRPLLAWLKVALQSADNAGDTAQADALRRRIALVAGDGADPVPPVPPAPR